MVTHVPHIQFEIARLLIIGKIAYFPENELINKAKYLIYINLLGQ